MSGTRPIWVMSILVESPTDDISQRISVSFHSLLLFSQCRLQSNTNQRILLPGTFSVILKRTQVSPNGTRKTSPVFFVSPVVFSFHQDETWLMASAARRDAPGTTMLAW